MTLAELGERCGYSAAQISRYERGIARLDTTLLRAFAAILEIPPADLGLSPQGDTPRAAESPDLRFLPPGSRKVVAVTSGKEDPVRRRDLLLSAGLAAPATLLARVNAALAVMPAPHTRVSAPVVTALLRNVQGQFDSGRLAELVHGIPGLLAVGHELTGQSGGERHLPLLAGCYDLASEALHKSGSTQAARITADRAVTYARLSGDPAAEAMAARSLAIVLRHEGRQDLAAEVTRAAAGRLTGSGLRTNTAANALAQVLCTAAYSAAQAGDRSEADAIITEARKSAQHVPVGLAGIPRFTVTLPQVTLYQVGIWWSLGEPGAALRAARGLHPAQFPTPERRARLLTDLARVWDLAGQPERAIGALLSACGQAASEVRDRPSIRSLASDLIRDHPADPRAPRLSGILVSGGQRQA